MFGMKVLTASYSEFQLHCSHYNSTRHELGLLVGYEYVSFEKISDRLKTLAKNFLKTNSNDDLIKPLIEAAKPSTTGKHSAVYKTLNW